MIKISSYKEKLDIVVEAMIRGRTGLVLMVYLTAIFCVVAGSVLYMSTW